MKAETLVNVLIAGCILLIVGAFAYLDFMAFREMFPHAAWWAWVFRR